VGGLGEGLGVEEGEEAEEEEEEGEGCGLVFVFVFGIGYVYVEWTVEVSLLGVAKRKGGGGGERWSEQRGKGGTFAEWGGAFRTVDKNVFDRQHSIACLSGLCTISAPPCFQAHHRSPEE